MRERFLKEMFCFFSPRWNDRWYLDTDSQGGQVEGIPRKGRGREGEGDALYVSFVGMQPW